MGNLLINTTGREGFVAWSEGGGVVREERWVMGRTSEEVLERVERVEMGEVPEKIGVVTGPGGFTQVRVGVVVANALGQGWGRKVVGVVGETEVDKLVGVVEEEEGEEWVKPYYMYEPEITERKKI